MNKILQFLSRYILELAVKLGGFRNCAKVKRFRLSIFDLVSIYNKFRFRLSHSPQNSFTAIIIIVVINNHGSCDRHLYS